MMQLFGDKALFNFDMNRWNVINVKDMRYMFYNAPSFNGDQSTWDESLVESTLYMFYDISSSYSDISRWNVSYRTCALFSIMNRPSMATHLPSRKHGDPRNDAEILMFRVLCCGSTRYAQAWITSSLIKNGSRGKYWSTTCSVHASESLVPGLWPLPTQADYLAREPSELFIDHDGCRRC